MTKTLLTTVLALFIPFSGLFAADRAVTNIAGDVYRFQNDFHYSMFVVTNDGVVVTDPIDTEAALWLRAEIGKLTDQPITHLIYSHSHGDHASGGAAFGDVSNVIAHENGPEAIDGVAINTRINKPTEIQIGDKTIELTPLGEGHGDDLMAMVVRPENVGFVVDAVSSKRLPFRDFPNANVDDWINQVRNVEALNFEIFAGGHGALGVKDDVAAARVYMEELRDQVLQGLKSGKTVDELSTSITMENYKDWASYDQWLALNIQGMARHLNDIGAAN